MTNPQSEPELALLLGGLRELEKNNEAPHITNYRAARTVLAIAIFAPAYLTRLYNQLVAAEKETGVPDPAANLFLTAQHYSEDADKTRRHSLS